MAKIHQSNNIRSLVLDRGGGATNGGHHFRLWTAFSGATFRRKIFDAVSCGGSSRYRHEFPDDDDEVVSVSTTTTSTSTATDSKKQEKPKQQKSEKLSDLLNLADTEFETTESEAATTKKKEEALEELKRVVRELQVEDDDPVGGGDGERKSKRRGIEAASRVRLLAKENPETRITLAMLGAIPPLAGMLDFEEIDSQIASLYALLNLGIGNDM
ncbi:hypothetical protein EZV62_013613 [Acer yangbiense]|uniref:Uncharacterized protein n=1 Tax=Acer yangbiense TaxID=1000413 RepID=A0A5C7HZ65_9ROSI|nr:hypothetical protein EZV62_013613 [Acer yangbiense]